MNKKLTAKERSEAGKALARLSVASPKRTKEYYQNLSKLGNEAKKRKAEERKKQKESSS